MSVLLVTSLGDIVIDLYVDERPRCCLNFLKLCKVKYYNCCLFHSIQKNLVAQTGDPTSTGRGGDSINARLYGEQARFFDPEVKPRIKHRRAGLVSMVNNGNDGHGSQFFITLSDNLDYLDGVHTVFGEVAEGVDVVSRLNEAYCDKEHRPYRDILIYHTIILNDPFPDPPGLKIPNRSPEPSQEVLNSDRIGAEEELDETTGLSKEEMEEKEKEKEARANAQVLTMIGDLPEVEAKPPENVLFVCKLNAVTTSEDLEVIFSRFGEIISCEVIKDKKTGSSLQYAFIEFAEEDDCENAYLKMENVLIDDRRIHVDFSQSVAKEWKKYRSGDVLKPKNMTGSKESQIILKKMDRHDPNYDYVFEKKEEVSSKREKKSERVKRSRSRERQQSKSREKDTKHEHKKKKRKRSHSREHKKKDKQRHKKDRH